jgi:hypothetical protein
MFHVVAGERALGLHSGELQRVLARMMLHS